MGVGRGSEGGGVIIFTNCTTQLRTQKRRRRSPCAGAKTVCGFVDTPVLFPHLSRLSVSRSSVIRLCHRTSSSCLPCFEDAGGSRFGIAAAVTFLLLPFGGCRSSSCARQSRINSLCRLHLSLILVLSLCVFYSCSLSLCVLFLFSLSLSLFVCLRLKV